VLQRSGRVRWPRVVALAVAAVLVLAAAAAGAVAWYFAGVAVAVDHHVDRPLTATLVAADRVQLPARADALLPGRYGLDWAGGYGEVGPVVSRVGAVVVRSFTPRRGTLAPGTPVRLDTYAYDGDPGTALGLPFEEVRVHDAVGDFPAWYVPARAASARPGSWFVFVHGHNGNRGEALRYLRALHAAGLPVLVPTYRNDVGAPASPDGVDHLGDTEWKDVGAAVHWALDHGARDVVLGGWSMGGAIALQVADRSDVAGRVRALVLDSPVIDWRDVLQHQGAARGLPAAETTLAVWAVQRRFGIDLDRFDWPARGPDLRVPTLLVAGDADTYVPDGPAQRLAAARPGLVTLQLVPAAGHTQGWNVDPAGYERRLVTWLSAHSAVAAAA
jgi:pimeloyl-ACP methyl ester carboxylesterase